MYREHPPEYREITTGRVCPSCLEPTTQVRATDSRTSDTETFIVRHMHCTRCERHWQEID